MPFPSPNQLVKELKEEAHGDDRKQKALPTGLVLCPSTTSLTRDSTSASASYHLMPMTHLPETRTSNPALETSKRDMLSSAGF